jgi:hypothetical protein
MPPPAPVFSPGQFMLSPTDRSGGAGMWSSELPTPPTSGVICGIGCNINVNAEGDLFVTKVIAGGPAAFSCEIAMGDVLVAVDGVSVCRMPVRVRDACPGRCGVIIQARGSC